MKYFIFVLVIMAASCCSSKKAAENNQAVPNPQQQDSVPAKGTIPASTVPEESLPACVKKMIASFKAEEVQNPPRKIYCYTYHGKTVYYVPAICCDFFSDLYNDQCEIIAHPDGGITGKGDGRAADFLQQRSHEKLLWADGRKP